MENVSMFLGDLLLSFFRYVFWLTHAYGNFFLFLLIILIILGLRATALFFSSLHYFLQWRRTEQRRHWIASYELLQDGFRGVLWTCLGAVIFFNIIFWF